MAMLYNTGVNCMPSDKELGELFGNRGDNFLKEAPARIMSQRGYGNMRSKFPIDPSKDVNTTYPDYKLVKGTFNNVNMDFPKGAGGVGDNPMWADGTYDEMKANFIKQADAQNDVRHLIPDLEDQRLKQYDLANFTGGTAQQNKLDFMLKEMMTEEQRIKNYKKIETIMKEFPTLSREDASKIVADEAVRERIRLMEKRGITMSDLMANDVAVNVVRMGHPDQAQDEARGGGRTTREMGTQTEPDGMAGYKYSKDIGSTYPYWKDTSRMNVSAPSRPVDERNTFLFNKLNEGKAFNAEFEEHSKHNAYEYLVQEDIKPSKQSSLGHRKSKKHTTPGELYSAYNTTLNMYAVPTPHMSRGQAGTLPGVGLAPTPMPGAGNAGGGGGGGGVRTRVLMPIPIAIRHMEPEPVPVMRDSDRIAYARARNAEEQARMTARRGRGGRR